MYLSGAKWLLISVLLLVPALDQAQETAPVGHEEPVWQPALDWSGGTGLFRTGDVPGDYNPLLLTLGRSIYADLQRARLAAIHKEAVNLSVALHEARDTLHRLRLPAGVMALEAQLQVIRNDLHDLTKSPDDSLWVPVEAEIGRVLVYAPDDLRGRVAEALRTGRAAADKRDRQTAEDQLDTVSASMQYSLGMFPLNRVRADLDAALTAAARRPEPDWTGALKAVQTMLATFHWYTQGTANTLLSAYYEVQHAYTLARGLYANPEHWRLVNEHLARARRLLADTPGDWGLSEQVRAASYQVELHGDDAVNGVHRLLNAVQSRIQIQRRLAERRYREMPAQVVTE
jgi:hypothetical protein